MRYVASLARLELTEEEAAEFQPQLDAIVGFVESLSALDSAESTDSTMQCGPMRDDVPHESLPPEGLLRNAPDQAQGKVRVPKVVADA